MRRRSLLLLLTLSFCVLAYEAPLPGRPVPTVAEAPRAAVVDASSRASAEAWAELDRRGWSASLQAAVQQARYAARPIETSDTEDDASAISDAVIVHNPAHGLRGTVSRAHAVVSSRAGDVTLRARAIGYGDELAPLTEGAVTTEGARVTVARAGGAARVDEWWVNRPSGLEHGFTVHAAPDTRGEGGEAGDAAWLRVAVELGGPLTPRATADGQALEFLDAAGAVALRYGGLQVFDATGRRLPARMHVATDHTQTPDPTHTTYITTDDTAAVYPVTIDPTFTQQAYLKPHNTDAGDWFGVSVAVSDDTVVIGAPYEEGSATTVNGPDDNAATDAGAAYVFVRDGDGQWSLQAYLKAHNAEAGDAFGWSVAVSGDTVVVGAYREDGSATTVNGPDDNLALYSGAAYVFVRDGGGQWSQQAYLKAHNAEADDQFGSEVAVSGDTVVVSALVEDGSATTVNGPDDNLAPGAGAAYVFVRDGAGQWSQQAYLKAHNADAGDWFGYSVDVSGDTVVVGAFMESGSATTVNGPDDNLADAAGAAYVFVRDGGGQWSQQAYLKAHNAEAGDNFGQSVSVSGDTVVVGAPAEDGSATTVNGADDNAASDAGAAYVFVRDGAGQWSQQAYLKAHNAEAGDRFGGLLAVSGNTVVVGAHREDGSATTVNGADDNAATNAGAAYVFMRDGAGQWGQHAYLKPHNAEAGDNFGGGRKGIAVSGDTVVVGANRENGSATTVNGPDDNLAAEAGAAYVFAVVPGAVFDFDGLGTWTWNRVSGWVQITAADPSQLEPWNGNVVADYGSAGTWLWHGATGDWTQLTPADPEQLQACGNNLFWASAASGTWRWNADTGWQQLTGVAPENMVCVAGTLAWESAAFGTWLYDVSTGWTHITGHDPDGLGSCGTRLVWWSGAFGTWIYDGSTGWTSITGASPDRVVCYGGRIAWEGAAGTWLYDFSTGWTQITAANPDHLLAWGDTLVWASAADGTWIYASAGWTQITAASPTQLAPLGRDLLWGGSIGTWVWRPGTGWTHLTALSPTAIVSTDEGP